MLLRKEVRGSFKIKGSFHLMGFKGMRGLVESLEKTQQEGGQRG